VMLAPLMFTARAKRTKSSALAASSGTPYRINLGNEWVEVPPPELFDLWDKASGNLPEEAARQPPR